ncbi:MAG: glutamate-1-semialdehyde 2,1-aminomutase [Gaiellaceae bacterium]|nr:MAG: glutamate-1-semialdehyde 2,1-aminomutase [Gaiellaceae bacterium]
MTKHVSERARPEVRAPAGLALHSSRATAESDHRSSAYLRERLHALIPGGAHTYAKGDDQFPAEAPVAIARGEGCRVWDVSGREFVEYGSGLRAVTLGHAFPPVIKAVETALARGSNFTRPSITELECAERLLELVPSAEMVKFTKDGSTATTAAVRLARAYTGRDLVALCNDHPFFSYDDWAMVTTPMDAGIPNAVRELSVTFRYNDLASLETIFANHAGEVACVVLEPERTDPPADGFLRRVEDLCRREGAVLILDETITGFRWHLGGAQTLYGVSPDLSIFGKGLANGFSVSALVGRRELMELGGLRHHKERVFLLSTTHGAETHALAAAIATMDAYVEHDVIDVLHDAGRRLREGIEEAARATGVADFVRVLGRDSNLVYETRSADGLPSQEFRTLLMQELVRRGILAPSLVVSYSHDDETLSWTVEQFSEALEVYNRALQDGFERYLVGSPVKPVYRRFN